MGDHKDVYEPNAFMRGVLNASGIVIVLAVLGVLAYGLYELLA